MRDNNSTVATARAPKQLLWAISLYAVGSIATGIVDLVWRDFEAAHEPIQAFGGHIPFRHMLACMIGACLVLAGLAILLRFRRRVGAAGLAYIYLLFAVFWLPRFYTAPHALGFNISLLVGLLVGVAQQLILVAAAAIVYLEHGPDRSDARMDVMIRWIFGLSSIDFGLAHLTAVRQVAAMVPEWIPFGSTFWVILTGCAFVAAGLAVVSGYLDVLAARLLALMLFIFSALVLAPRALAHPANQIGWGSNAYNLTAVAAVWIYAEWRVARRYGDSARV